MSARGELIFFSLTGMHPSDCPDDFMCGKPWALSLCELQAQAREELERERQAHEATRLELYSTRGELRQYRKEARRRDRARERELDSLDAMVSGFPQDTGAV